MDHDKSYNYLNLGFLVGHFVPKVCPFSDSLSDDIR